jgi:hypothetical protein
VTGWWLSVDFGSSNTAAATSVGGVVRPLQFRGRGLSMPSAVLWAESGVLVGWSAERRRVAEPGRFVRAPKGMVTGQPGPVLVGDAQVDPVEVVAAVLRAVWKEALDQHDQRPPERLLLTHPVLWAQAQVEQLAAAAERAGMPREALEFVAEPVAAAQHYAAAGEAVTVGGSVAVFDFGGGTCDVALVERTSAGEYRVLDFDGDPHLGGADFDQLILDWVMAELAERGRQDLLGELAADTDAGLRAKLNLRDEVRDAKENLSTLRQVGIMVSGAGRVEELTLTRRQYDEMIRPRVDRAVGLLTGLLNRAGTRPGKLYLTGGSSHTPAVQDAITTSTGITPATLDDPKLVVAEGALHTPRTPVTETVPLPEQPRPPQQPEPPRRDAAADSPPVFRLPVLTGADFKRAVSAGTVLACFWSPQSAPSVAFLDTLTAFALQRPDLTIGTVNVDQEPALAARYRIQQLPTLAGHQHGRHVRSLAGAVDRPTLERFVRDVQNPPPPVVPPTPTPATTERVEPPDGWWRRYGWATIAAVVVLIVASSTTLALALSGSPTGGGSSTPASGRTPTPVVSTVTPTPTTPSPTPTPTALSASEQQLLDELPAGLVKGCVSNSSAPQLEAASAGLTCDPSPDVSGASEMLEVDVFRIYGSATAVHETLRSSWTDACPGYPKGNWAAKTNGPTAGAISCGTSTDDQQFLAWSFDSHGIGLLAFAKDGVSQADVITWWKNTPVP